MKPLSKEEWLAEKRKFIGGSEAAKVCGVSPWGGLFDVWLFKTQGIVPEETDRMYWGSKLEAAVIGRFAEDHPDMNIVPLHHVIYRHSEYDFMGCTPDGIIKEDGGGLCAIVEAKTTGVMQADRWGDENTDQVPDEVLIQCLHNMLVVDVHTCFAPLLIGGNEYRLYRVERGPGTADTETKIINAERDFWERYIITGNEPPMDGSEAAKKYVKGLFPANVSDDPEPANEVEAAAIAALKQRYLQKKAAVAAYDAQANEVKRMIGDRAGLISADGKVTWKQQEDSPKIDWKAVAYELEPSVPSEAFKRAVTNQTTIKPGNRPLMPPRNWGRE